MTFEEIFESEEREDNDLFTIYFHKEGDWWRAYEWSAYLATHFECVVDGYVPLNAIKKSWSGNEDGIISVGLKEKSFDKYFPDVLTSDERYDINENLLEIRMENTDDGIKQDTYKSYLKKWKDSVKLSKKDSKNKQKHNGKIIDVPFYREDENDYKSLMEAQIQIFDGTMRKRYIAYNLLSACEI